MSWKWDSYRLEEHGLVFSQLSAAQFLCPLFASDSSEVLKDVVFCCCSSSSFILVCCVCWDAFLHMTVCRPLKNGLSHQLGHSPLASRIKNFALKAATHSPFYMNLKDCFVGKTQTSNF